MSAVQDVVAAILISGNKVLIAQRNKDDHLAELWELPGGKVEQGETPEGSLAREMREELGINVAVGEFFAASTYNYAQGAIRLLAYRCQWVSGVMEASVHMDYKWVTANELGHYVFAPADIPLVDQLKAAMIQMGHK